MSKILMPLRAFAVANQVLKDGHARYAIHAVSVEAGPVALATDGRAILAVAWEGESVKKPLLIAAEELCHVKKLALLEDKRADKIALDSARQAQVADRVFPNVRKCIPFYEESKCTVATMDAKRLGTLLLNMAKCMGECAEPIVTIKVPHDPTRPIVRFGGPASEAQSVLAVLMPYNQVEYNPLPQIKELLVGGEKPAAEKKGE